MRWGRLSGLIKGDAKEVLVIGGEIPPKEVWLCCVSVIAVCGDQERCGRGLVQWGVADANWWGGEMQM